MLIKTYSSKAEAADYCACGIPVADWQTRPHSLGCPENMRNLTFVGWLEPKEDEATTHLLKPTLRLRGYIVSYDETRAYFAGLKLDLYCQQRGRIEAILSQTTTADLRDSILNVLTETEAAVKAIGERESAAIISNLSYRPDTVAS